MQLEVRGAELLRVGGIALLGHWGREARNPACECMHQQLGARLDEAPREGGQVGAVDRDGDRLIDRPRVEALVERHERDARHLVAGQDGPLDRGRSPPARQQ